MTATLNGSLLGGAAKLMDNWEDAALALLNRWNMKASTKSVAHKCVTFEDVKTLLIVDAVTDSCILMYRDIVNNEWVMVTPEDYTGYSAWNFAEDIRQYFNPGDPDLVEVTVL